MGFPLTPPLLNPGATGLRRPAPGALKLECTFLNCTTLLVKGTSGHLKHAAGESRSLACCGTTIYGG